MRCPHLRSTLLVLFAWPFLTACVALQDSKPATPQRPTLSSDTSTTAVGTIEIEAGGSVDPNDFLDLPIALKWGTGPGSEVFLGWSPYQKLYLTGSDAEGVGDLQIGVRHRFAEESEAAPSLAFQLNTKLPTGDRSDGLSSGELDFFGALIASKNFDGWSGTLFYQAGLIGDPAAPDTDVEHAIAFAAGVSVAEKLSVFGEVAAQIRPETDTDPTFLTVGAAYALSPARIVDVAFVVGLDDESPDFQILFGVTSNLGRLFRAPR